jgi:hypothetical protein
MGDARILAQLDRVYVYLSQIGGKANHTKEYTIQGDSIYFDHIPVLFEIELQLKKPAGVGT